jgi:hypothetical protein
MRKNAPEHEQLVTIATRSIEAAIADARRGLAAELAKLDALGAALPAANAADAEAPTKLAEELRTAALAVARHAAALKQGADTFQCLAVGEVWEDEPAKPAPADETETAVSRLLDHARRPGNCSTTFDVAQLGALIVGYDSGLYDVGTSSCSLFWGTRKLMQTAIAALLRSAKPGA